MKVQNVKKECLAIVGLSIEFSNSEISSLSRLLTTVRDAAERGVEAAKVEAMKEGTTYSSGEKVECVIDLKSLMRIEWLLTQLTRNEESGLFNQADDDCENALERINKINL